MPERQSKLQITERQVEDLTVLSLTGEILLDDGDIAFGKCVDGLLAKGGRKFVIDLSGVTYIDSAGVGMMVAEQKIVQQKGGKMKLAGLTSRSNRLLSTMRLSTAFEIYDDEAAALRSFVWGARTDAGG
jgi:anti-sigma B factor antagonist